ncbi:MAG: hypothetical protein IIV02_08145 [Peptococcaceae bacterium]|nr:hypothetical protein [Peptococcaceae bacterium]
MIEFYGDNKIQKASSHAVALLRLRSFLDKNEPKLVYFLQNMWNSQRRAITYKELREAILHDIVSASLLEEWQEDYSNFLIEHLIPIWLDAMDKASAPVKQHAKKFVFNPMADGVHDWVTTYGASFVTNSTQTQIQALNGVIRMATRLEDYTVDELAMVIRPIVGLNQPQALANMRYYKTMREYGLSHEKALDKSVRYAARQHRQRGYLIARTELAHGYNKGEYFAVKQAQEKGYMGECVKVWCTADDERVCGSCGPMDGMRIALDDEFDFSTKLDGWTRLTPPLHPNCRCGFLIEEIAPPQTDYMSISY